jgi:hypothetical protein
MTGLRRFAAFWVDFVIGDDWRVAVAVLAGLGLTWAVHHATGLPAWLPLPVVAFATLAASVRTAAVSRRRR